MALHSSSPPAGPEPCSQHWPSPSTQLQPLGSLQGGKGPKDSSAQPTTPTPESSPALWVP